MTSSSEANRPTPRAWPRVVIGVVLLIASLVVDIITVRKCLRTEPVRTEIAPAPLGDSPETAARRRDVAGVFATGTQPGDRVITIDAAGAVHFALRGSAALIPGDADAWQLARRGDDYVLVTRANGTIAIEGIDALRYWGDIYRRQ
jgi:hypothetical protein